MHTIGIIGAGMIAEKHLDNISKNPRLEVTYVADLDPDRLVKVAKKYKIKKTSTDYHDILHNSAVEAVLICTPPHLHKAMFIDSLKAHKHVFLEKPASMTLQELDEMIDMQKKYPDMRVCECSARHSRLQPKFDVVKKIIDSGKLGDIYYIHHNSLWRNGRPGIEYNPEAKWFMNKKLSGGGPLFDWGVYDLSFHLGVMGDKPELESIKDVFLKSGLDAYDPGNLVYDIEEMFGVHMTLSGGIRYFWERGNHGNMDVPNETRIYGTRGGLKFGFCSWDSETIHLYDYDENGKPQQSEMKIDMKGHSDDAALIDHFADILDGKVLPAMPLEKVRKHLDIIWKCYENAD